MSPKQTVNKSFRIFCCKSSARQNYSANRPYGYIMREVKYFQHSKNRTKKKINYLFKRLIHWFQAYGTLRNETKWYFAKRYFAKWYFAKWYFAKWYFAKRYFAKWYFAKRYFAKRYFPKWYFAKWYFVK